jgi:hypothetical protein
VCRAIPLLYQYVFVAWCLVKHRDNFTFTFYGKTGIVEVAYVDFNENLWKCSKDTHKFNLGLKVNLFLFFN